MFSYHLTRDFGSVQSMSYTILIIKAKLFDCYGTWGKSNVVASRGNTSCQSRNLSGFLFKW